MGEHMGKFLHTIQHHSWDASCNPAAAYFVNCFYPIENKIVRTTNGGSPQQPYDDFGAYFELFRSSTGSAKSPAFRITGTATISLFCKSSTTGVPERLEHPMSPPNGGTAGTQGFCWPSDGNASGSSYPFTDSGCSVMGQEYIFVFDNNANLRYVIAPRYTVENTITYPATPVFSNSGQLDTLTLTGGGDELDNCCGDAWANQEVPRLPERHRRVWFRLADQHPGFVAVTTTASKCSAQAAVYSGVLSAWVADSMGVGNE